MTTDNPLTSMYPVRLDHANYEIPTQLDSLGIDSVELVETVRSDLKQMAQFRKTAILQSVTDTIQSTREKPDQEDTDRYFLIGVNLCDHLLPLESHADTNEPLSISELASEQAPINDLSVKFIASTDENRLCFEKVPETLADTDYFLLLATTADSFLENVQDGQVGIDSVQDALSDVLATREELLLRNDDRYAEVYTVVISAALETFGRFRNR